MVAFLMTFINYGYVMGLWYDTAMKALVIADRQPNIDLASTVNQENIDLVITLGDLVREDLLGLEEVKHIPKIGVYGNHDSGMYMSEFDIWGMHLKIWDFKGLRFGGFRGYVQYKDNPDAIMYTQEEANVLMRGFPAVDVFYIPLPAARY